MKTRYIWAFCSLMLFSCNGNHNGSDAYGNFEAKEVIVSAEAQGKLLKFNLEEGDKIGKDKLVGIIDTVSLSIQKEQLIAQKEAVASKIANVKAQIDVQEQQKKVLKTEKDRIENLFNENAATKQKLDDINGKYDILEKQVEATKTQLNSVLKEINVVDKQVKLMDEKLNKAYIKNPVKGIVLEKYLEENEIAIAGKALYKIAPLEEIDLRVYVSGAQLPHIKTGQKVKVFVDKDEDTNQEYEGKISWISDQAEFTPKIIQTKEERVNMVYAVKVRVKNDGKLKIGMPGEVKFEHKN